MIQKLSGLSAGSIAIELTNSAIPMVLVNVELKCDAQRAGGDSPPKRKT